MQRRTTRAASATYPSSHSNNSSSCICATACQGHVCHISRQGHVCHVRRQGHVCHVRRQGHVSFQAPLNPKPGHLCHVRRQGHVYHRMSCQVPGSSMSCQVPGSCISQYNGCHVTNCHVTPTPTILRLDGGTRLRVL
jgi:hypothetical protein